MDIDCHAQLAFACNDIVGVDCHDFANFDKVADSHNDGSGGIIDCHARHSHARNDEKLRLLTKSKYDKPPS